MGVALVGLTVLLGLIAAIAMGNLYAARQVYEDRLARAYELEAASSRLLASGVIEEAALVSGGRAARTRRAAARAFDAQARSALRLARGDAPSRRLVRARVRAQRRARRLAGDTSRRARRALARTLAAARRGDQRLTSRQAARRARARDRAAGDSRRALITAAVAGALALLGALAVVGVLVASIRRPLDDLVGATRRLARGELDERVEPGGPQELTELGNSFNAMAGDLGMARSELEEERRKLATVIESLGDALVVSDPSGTVTDVNPSARQIVPELGPGDSVDGPESPLPPLAHALSGEVMRERGDRVLSITAARLGPGGEEGVVWTVRDVTDRALLERTKSDFVATASHELRSPLTSIKGFVELLSRSEELVRRDREFVDVILQSTDRLVDLVNDLLDVARLEAGKMEVHPRLFDLGETVREVVELMRPQIEDKAQRLDVRVPPGLPRALADPARSRQIVTNLISNAHEYTEEGGRLSVSLRREGDSLALAVSDTGRGMTEAELERVFDRFVRRPDGGGGTGLGLNIVRSLVELQRGSIEVQSAPGEGSTFTVLLPAEPEGTDGAAPRGAIRGKRVLVVDGDREAAALTAEQLATFGAETEVAHTGDEAIGHLRGGRFDAMTLDLTMSGGGGVGVLRTVRSDPELRRTPVVVISMAATGEALPGEWKVAKPAEPATLADVLGSAVLAGRTSVLVAGRSALRARLEPALVRLGLDHDWVTSAAAAAQASRQRRFEVALVDAGMRDPDEVLRAVDLRGRRLGRAVLLFTDGEADEAPAHLGADTVPIERAPAAVLEALGRGAPGEEGGR